jgi:hypothetical protein
MLKVCDNSSMGAVIRILAVGGLALVIGIGCSSRNQIGSGLSRDPRVASSQVGEIEFNIALMRGFDANRDGFVTREEFEVGLRAQFERADTDHNGSLNLSEMQAENGRRWQASGTASSPLIDWNVDGAVSFAEFSGTAQSVFSQLDRDRSDTLSGAELEAPRVRGVARPAARSRGPESARTQDGKVRVLAW